MEACAIGGSSADVCSFVLLDPVSTVILAMPPSSAVELTGTGGRGLVGIGPFEGGMRDLLIQELALPPRARPQDTSV